MDPREIIKSDELQARVILQHYIPMLSTLSVVALLFGTVVHAHIAPWGAGMYCKNVSIYFSCYMPVDAQLLVLVGVIFGVRFGVGSTELTCRQVVDHGPA